MHIHEDTYACVIPLVFTSYLLKFQEMTPEAEIISTRYTKSVIKSCAAMSYIEAQAKMDDRWCTVPIAVYHLKDNSSFFSHLFLLVNVCHITSQ